MRRKLISTDRLSAHQSSQICVHDSQGNPSPSFLPAFFLPRAPMLQSHCRLAIPKASVNSALPWSLIEGQFIISYPARVEGEWKRVSHYFPDPTHTLTDFEVLVVGLVKFVCAACNQMRKSSLADHQTCHHLLQACRLQQSESYFATHGWHGMMGVVH